MSFCVVVQKDTLENDKVKAVVAACENPSDFVQELQSGHCIEYQLLAHTSNSEDLMNRVTTLIAPFKTSFGINWYDLNHHALSQIMTLFLEHGTATIDLKSISEIMKFSLRISPAVTKEIKISQVSKNSQEAQETGEEIITLLENLQVAEKDSRRKKDPKKEIKKETSKKVKKDT